MTIGGKILRRIIDITIASVGVVATGLPVLFAAAAIRITTGQSAIFKQTRYGLHGLPFTFYKLRSMRDVYGNDGQLLSDDQRKTRLGSLLRRSGIDELPQLVNVLKGDMSLFGPRPQYYEIDTSEWRERYQIKPGLVGLAKIREKQSGCEFTAEEQLSSDIEYINSRKGGGCLKLDMYVLWRAAALVVDHKIDPPPRHSEQMSTNELIYNGSLQHG